MTIQYELRESGSFRPIATYATKAEALDALHALGTVIYGGWDCNFPDCYDAFLPDGRILVIEPVGVAS